jgi:hypothetical protein
MRLVLTQSKLLLKSVVMSPMENGREVSGLLKSKKNDDAVEFKGICCWCVLRKERSSKGSGEGAVGVATVVSVSRFG